MIKLEPVIKYISDFVKTSPVLEEIKKLNIDYLGTGEGECVIESVPADPIIKRYVDGTTQRQLLFVFASKEFYGGDELENLDNLGFYESLQAWFEEVTDKNLFPPMGAGREPLSIQALTSGYIFDASEENRARYQLQARFTYLQE